MLMVSGKYKFKDFYFIVFIRISRMIFCFYQLYLSVILFLLMFNLFFFLFIRVFFFNFIFYSRITLFV